MYVWKIFTSTKFQLFKFSWFKFSRFLFSRFGRGSQKSRKFEPRENFRYTVLWLCHYLVASSSMYCHLLISTIKCAYILMKCNIHYTVQWVVPGNSVVYWPSSERGTGLLNHHVILMWTLHSMLTKQIAHLFIILTYQLWYWSHFLTLTVYNRFHLLHMI